MPEHEPPVSFPVAPDNTPIRRRSAFSRSVFGLINRHAVKDEVHGVGRSRRRKVSDEALHLIDDLTNRPIDPMFGDSTLVPQRQSRTMTWVTKVLTFVFCVIVGISGCVIVQELHMNTRQKVREELASQVVTMNDKQHGLESDVASLRSQIDSMTKNLHANADSTAQKDSILNGTAAVSGPGVTVTLTDPIAAENQKGDLPRDDHGHAIRVVSDTDLQMFVSRLWDSGAEAIAINGVRIGVQSSIRVAGQTILVGVTSVESPYRIQAIGDRYTLSQSVRKQNNATLYDSLAQVGIYPEVAQSATITLEASSAPDLKYARKE
ncbi:DUF881 domain-containing protein [Bifidobacterium sp. SMB2]|uniref:DUF881 domain-containing protein n=1 Tax=Bifidobacterium saimiriisciurei TaxID=2661627 RepID=A0ABX0CIU2_9BIFI|nr:MULTISPECIES: DUF881 domain-containing protein [Bifidobacterium]NEG96821.1 DUF881 domain-containing protein [Bifidobacterium sp. SMB2]NEH12290.1 DUF881 domain-containing protein [Bifidobacterium saimiriisciurei]